MELVFRWISATPFSRISHLINLSAEKKTFAPLNQTIYRYASPAWIRVFISELLIGSWDRRSMIALIIFILSPEAVSSRTLVNFNYWVGFYFKRFWDPSLYPTLIHKYFLSWHIFKFNEIVWKHINNKTKLFRLLWLVF